MKSPIQQRVHFIKEVTLPSLTFKSKPHYGQCDIWLGGELAKEVAFIYVFVTILSKHILLCSVAFWFSFLLSCYTIQLTFLKIGPILHPKFFVFCLTRGLKNYKFVQFY